jgi:SAM-dependent methyltransferase
VGQRRDWDDLAAADPLWAVLSVEDRKGGRWNLEEFFATGEAEVQHLLATAAGLGRPGRHERALDFGCGVGRVTRALARRFRECVGVDISDRMVELANELNADLSNCQFASTGADEPELPPAPFDFVCANLVLQHLPNRALAREYIARLLEVLDPGGLFVFQIPERLRLSDRLQPRRRVYRTLRLLGVRPNRLFALGLHPVRMLAIPERHVRQLVASLGAVVAEVEPAGGAGLRYYVHHRSP